MQTVEVSACQSRMEFREHCAEFSALGHLLPRISQMTSHTLAHELRQTFKNKVFDAFDAKVTGEPDG
jgi:hypothetical protein